MKKSFFSVLGIFVFLLVVLMSLSPGETKVSSVSTPGTISFDGNGDSSFKTLSVNPIHEGINLMGHMYETGVYNDNEMASVIGAYWDGSSWSVGQKWGDSPLDGYVVYAVARAALKYRSLMINNFPTTSSTLEDMLRDYVSRDLNNYQPDWFFEGIGEWNSWSEDFMGFALGFAGVDVWFKLKPEYESRCYEQKVRDAVTRAFTINNYPDPNDGDPPRTLEYRYDFIEGSWFVIMRNHWQYNPVYAMAIIKHIYDINTIYAYAGKPNFYNSSNIPPSLDSLYSWVYSKIQIDPLGRHTFESNTCVIYGWNHCGPCDDSVHGHQREPGHYPLAEFLPSFGISYGLDLFGPPCNEIGPACIVQRPHNYYYNCIFTDLWTSSIQPYLRVHYYGVNGPEVYDVTDACLDHEIEFVFDASLGRFEERPEGGCFPPHMRKDNPTFVKLQMLPRGHYFVEGMVKDTWGDWLVLNQDDLDNMVNNSKLNVTNTDPYQSENCYWTNEPRYLYIGDVGWFEVWLRDSNGKDFVRRINMRLVGDTIMSDY
jgi:hypothetical protein